MPTLRVSSNSLSVSSSSSTNKEAMIKYLNELAEYLGRADTDFSMVGGGYEENEKKKITTLTIKLRVSRIPPELRTSAAKAVTGKE